MINHRLNKFFVISIVIHLLGAFAATGYLYNKDVISDPKPIVIDYLEIPSAEEKTAKKPQINDTPVPEKLVEKEQPKKRELVVKKKPTLKKEEVKKVDTPDMDRVEKKTEQKQTAYQKVQKVTTKTKETERMSANSDTKTDKGSKQGVILAYPNYKVNPKPDYPMIARRRGYEGEVLVKVWVLKNGKVGDTKLEKPSGYNILDDSALDAVKEWEFIPGKKNGEAVSSWVTVPITFRLKNS